VSIIDIARLPDEVFSYATDPSRFREWQQEVVSGASSEVMRGSKAAIEAYRSHAPSRGVAAEARGAYEQVRPSA
jgi:hypothetical protein